MGAEQSSEAEGKKRYHKLSSEQLNAINIQNEELRSQIQQMQIALAEVEIKKESTGLTEALKKEKEELEAKVNQMTENIKKLMENKQGPPPFQPPNYWQQQPQPQFVPTQQNPSLFHPPQQAFFVGHQHPMQEGINPQNHQFQQPQFPENYTHPLQNHQNYQTQLNQWSASQARGSNLYQHRMPQRTNLPPRNNYSQNTSQQNSGSTNSSGFTNGPRYNHQHSNNNCRKNQWHNGQSPSNNNGAFNQNHIPSLLETPLLKTPPVLPQENQSLKSNGAFNQNHRPPLLKTPPVLPQENQSLKSINHPQETKSLGVQSRKTKNSKGVVPSNDKSQGSNNHPQGTKSFGVQSRKTENPKGVDPSNDTAYKSQGRSNKEGVPYNNRPLFIRNNNTGTRGNSHPNQQRFPKTNGNNKEGQQQNNRFVNHGRHRGGHRGYSNARNTFKPSENSSFCHERRTNFKRSSARGSARDNTRHQSGSTEGLSSASDNEDAVFEGLINTLSGQPQTKPATKTSDISTNNLKNESTVLEKEKLDELTNKFAEMFEDHSNTENTKNSEETEKKSNKSRKSKAKKKQQNQKNVLLPDIVGIKTATSAPKDTKLDPLSKTNLGEDDLLMQFIGTNIPTLLDAVVLNIDLNQEVKGVVVMSDPDIKNPTLESPKTLLDIVNFKMKYPNAKTLLL